MSRKPYSVKRGDVDKPPEGPWCWLSRDLLTSPAWKRRSIHCMRLIDFLMTEHLAHGGSENGNLAAPWDQLAQHGLGRRYIKAAIGEAVALKLIAVNLGGMRASNRAAMSRYRLTFYATHQKHEDGTDYWVAPGNEWRKVTDAAAREYFASRPAWNEPQPPAKKKRPGAHGVTKISHTV